MCDLQRATTLTSVTECSRPTAPMADVPEQALYGHRCRVLYSSTRTQEDEGLKNSRAVPWNVRRWTPL